jgi:hypothetical protein
VTSDFKQCFFRLCCIKDCSVSFDGVFTIFFFIKTTFSLPIVLGKIAFLTLFCCYLFLLFLHSLTLPVASTTGTRNFATEGVSEADGQAAAGPHVVFVVSYFISARKSRSN